jgi:hypothetical protein
MASVDTGHNRSETTPDREDRREWCNPELKELGNLKDFVQTGHAFGKSVLINDGNAMAGGESMP